MNTLSLCKLGTLSSAGKIYNPKKHNRNHRKPEMTQAPKPGEEAGRHPDEQDFVTFPLLFSRPRVHILLIQNNFPDVSAFAQPRNPGAA